MDLQPGDILIASYSGKFHKIGVSCVHRTNRGDYIRLNILPKPVSLSRALSEKEIEEKTCVSRLSIQPVPLGYVTERIEGHPVTWYITYTADLPLGDLRSGLVRAQIIHDEQEPYDLIDAILRTNVKGGSFIHDLEPALHKRSKEDQQSVMLILRNLAIRLFGASAW